MTFLANCKYFMLISYMTDIKHSKPHTLQSYYRNCFPTLGLLGSLLQNLSNSLPLCEKWFRYYTRNVCTSEMRITDFFYRCFWFVCWSLDKMWNHALLPILHMLCALHTRPNWQDQCNTLRILPRYSLCTSSTNK